MSCLPPTGKTGILFLSQLRRKFKRSVWRNFRLDSNRNLFHKRFSAASWILAGRKIFHETKSSGKKNRHHCHRLNFSLLYYYHLAHLRGINDLFKYSKAITHRILICFSTLRLRSGQAPSTSLRTSSFDKSQATSFRKGGIFLTKKLKKLRYICHSSVCWNPGSMDPAKFRMTNPLVIPA